jgi:hypothetical protein
MYMMMAEARIDCPQRLTAIRTPQTSKINAGIPLSVPRMFMDQWPIYSNGGNGEADPDIGDFDV